MAQWLGRFCILSLVIIVILIFSVSIAGCSKQPSSANATQSLTPTISYPSTSRTTAVITTTLITTTQTPTPFSTTTTATPTMTTPVTSPVATTSTGKKATPAPPPTVVSANGVPNWPPSPTSSPVYPGYSFSITSIEGSGFQPGAFVKLNRSGYFDIILPNPMVVSPTKIRCSGYFVIPINAGGGQWDVVVKNPDGQSGSLPKWLTVTAPETLGPTNSISSVSPSQGMLGASVNLTITGSGFKNPANVLFSRNTGGTFNCGNTVVSSDTQITCVFVIPPRATELMGPWDVIEVNILDNQYTTSHFAFNIINATS